MDAAFIPRRNGTRHPAEGGVRVSILSEPSEIDALISLFEAVAKEEGWQPEGQLRAHVARSVYFGLWVGSHAEGVEEVLAGGLQLVLPDVGGGVLSCQSVWPELDFAGRSDVAHIAVLAEGRQWRGKAGGLFWPLTAAMWNYCVRAGIRELWLEATPRTCRCYERIGWPLKVRADLLREHWGEPCFPCSLSVREVAGALAERAVRSGAYRRVLASMVGSNSQSFSNEAGCLATIG